ncbi:MAG: LamG domain-containing protein [Phycisphaerae bacterium]|nr:LamG domain-containing protein [Phycisphaerae bacterium]
MRRVFLPCLVGLVLLAGKARGDEIAAFFESVYGEEARRVQATSTKADDVQFSERLLEAAKGIEGSPKVVALLCDKTYEFASRDVAGHGTAIAAMRLLADTVPERKISSLEAVIDLRRRAYRMARRGEAKIEAGEVLLETILGAAGAASAAGQMDGTIGFYRQALPLASALRSPEQLEIQQLLNEAVARQRTLRRAAELRAVLEARPNDREAGMALLRIHVVELDDPVGARRYTFLADDESWKTNVPLATRPVEQLPAAEALKMGEWYRGLADAAPRDSKARMLGRARDYYHRFLEQDEGAGLAKLKATAGLKMVESALDALAPRTASRLPASLRRGLVLHYGFDRNDKAVVRDRSGQGNDGKVVGAKWIRNGRGSGNGVFELDGNDNLIQIPTKTLGNWEALTYCVWVKVPQYRGGNWPSFIGSHTADPGYNTTIGIWQSSGRFRSEVDTDRGNHYLKGSLAIPWDQWFHAAMVYDGSTLTEYLNGVRGSSSKASGKLKDVRTLTIGRDHPRYHALRGLVDDVMVFSRALSEKEIQVVYRAQFRK